MLVDPATGMPIEEGYEGGLGPIAGGSSSITGGAIAGQLGQAGYEGGTLYNMSLHIPSAFATTGWNAYRGSNTIMKGGYATAARGRMSNHLSPRSITRLSHVDNLNGASSGKYSPFDILSRGTNWGFNKTASSSMKHGGKMFARMQKAGMITPEMDADLMTGKKAQFAESGMLSKISASSRYARKYGDAALSPKRAAQVAQSVGRMDSGLSMMAQYQGVMNPGGQITGHQAGRMTLMTAKTPIGQAVGGYMSGVMHGAGSAAEQRIARTAGREIFAKASTMGAEHLALGGGKGLLTGGLKIAGGAAEKGAMKFAAARTAQLAGLAIPGVNLAMTAWMAYDLTRMGMEALAGAPEFAADAVKSMTGSINKPIMGMGYKDTAVAATSRSRGVMAIQNSRLNSRSALGSEAAYLHGHFG